MDGRTDGRTNGKGRRGGPPRTGFCCALAGMLPASPSAPCLHVRTQTHAVAPRQTAPIAFCTHGLALRTCVGLQRGPRKVASKPGRSCISRSWRTPSCVA